MAAAPMSHPTPSPDDHAALERHVLQLVGQLVGELRPGSATAGIGPGDSLERELGIGSLERVELLTRIERGVGVRLADSVMAAADTPADLVRAIVASEPAVAETLPSVLAPIGAAIPAPASAQTLLDVLHWQAQTTPERTQIFLRQEDGTEHPITYAWLWRRAVVVAAALRARGIGRRDTVTIMLRTEAAFFPAFFGTLLAGAIPVPIYPPFRADRIAEYAQRQVGILSNAATRLMITFAEVERLAGVLRGQIPTLTTVTTLDDLAPATDEGGPLPAGPPVWLTGEDPALIQYTSGSTGQPKGVLLTHANLLANIRAVGEGPRDPSGRRRRQLAAALSRHGADRRLARHVVFRGTGRDSLAAGLPVTTGALAVGDSRASGHVVGRPELRVRSVCQQDHRRGDRRAGSQLAPCGAQRLGGRAAGDRDPLCRSVRSGRVSSRRDAAGLRTGRVHGRPDLHAAPAPAACGPGDPRFPGDGAGGADHRRRRPRLRVVRRGAPGAPHPDRRPDRRRPRRAHGGPCPVPRSVGDGRLLPEPDRNAGGHDRQTAGSIPATSATWPTRSCF